MLRDYKSIFISCCYLRINWIANNRYSLTINNLIAQFSHFRGFIPAQVSKQGPSPFPLFLSTSLIFSFFLQYQ